MNNEWENAELYVDLCDETAHKVVHYAGQLKSRLMLTGNEIIGLKELLASERADWLRSEIEKLDKMLRDPSDYLDPRNVTQYNSPINSIITRYKEELEVLESNV